MTFVQQLLGSIEHRDSTSTVPAPSIEHRDSTSTVPAPSLPPAPPAARPLSQSQMQQHASNSESLLSDLMTTNALGTFKDQRRRDRDTNSTNSEQSISPPNQQSKPSYFPDSDLMSAPDVQLRYKHTLTVDATAAINENEDSPNPAGGNRRRAPSAPAGGSAAVTPPSRMVAKDDVLKDRLQKAQQAFASLREPASSNGLVAQKR